MVHLEVTLSENQNYTKHYFIDERSLVGKYIPLVCFNSLEVARGWEGSRGML